MGSAGTVDTRAQAGWETAHLWAAGDRQCGSLLTARRRRLAHDAARPAPVGHYLPVLAGLAEGRYLGARPRYAARREVRQAMGKNAQPSAGIVDSQSVKTTDRGGVHGYDAGKKINGRKRHVLVDTLGLVWLVVVTAASTQDRDGARTLLAVLATRMRRLRLIWADGG